MTDYHSKPVLSARVDAAIKAWTRDEAKRRGQGVGDFLEDVLIAERDRAASMVGHVVDHSPVAAGDDQPQQARRHAPNCKCWTCKPPEESKP